MNSESQTYQGLLRLRERGFSPSSILDIGAHVGNWARSARVIFPDSYIFLVDALVEKEGDLRQACLDIGNADYAVALLGEEEMPETDFFVVHAGQDQSGSSKYRENTRFPKETRAIPQVALDNLAPSDRRFPFVKLDVQGAEIDVLRGGNRILAETEVILMEVAILQYNRGAPLIADVLMAMRNWGFILYDILDEHRADGVKILRQIDVLFIRSSSKLRPQPPF